MQSLIALVGLPVVLLATTTGLGLLAERLARVRLPNALLAPLGFCLATSVLLAVYELGANATVAAILLAAGTLAGFALARSELPARLNPGWPGLAALAVYGLYAAPVLLTGGWTWSGYNFLNDTAVQFLLIEHLGAHGTDVGSLPATTGGDVIRTYLSTGYPIGTHAFAATLSALLGSGPEVIYEAYLAAMAALAAMSLASLCGRTAFGPKLGALVGAVALASNLTYNNGLQGSIKEIGVIAALTAAAAIGRELVRSEDPVRMAALLGVALASIISVYSAAGLPYVAALLATLAVAVALTRGRKALQRRWLWAVASAGVVSALLAAPALASILTFYRVASAVVDATAPVGDVLGQLAHPLALLQAGGIWLDGAYQTPISPSATAEQWTNIGLWTIAVLALLSLVEIVRRRQVDILLALVPAALTAALVAPGVVPYADAKLLAIMSPSVVIAAALGLRAIGRIARPAGPALAIVLATALVGGVLLSDAFALHDSRVAPRDRMVALREVGDRVAGRGPVLYNEFEEFAKYFADASWVNVGSESITPRQVQLRDAESVFGKYFDLDLQKLDYVDGFATIVMRRSPSASRPPARYRRIFANRYYEAWARGAGPVTLVHLPLQRLDDATAPARCDRLRALAGRGRRSSGDVALVAAYAPPTARMDVLRAERSAGLLEDQGVPGTANTITPAYARGRIAVPGTGIYRLWLRGSFPRATEVFLDGTRRAVLRGANTPGQWLGDVPLSLQAGEHRVEIRIPGGSARPGDGAAVGVGPLALVADRSRRLQIVPVSRWRSLCGRELDWVELVRR